MNLKNNYLLKKLLKWAKKKQNNFNIYNVAFFKKIKKNTRIYHYFTSMYQKSEWYDLQFLRWRAWHTEIGNFRSFFTLLPKKNPKNQNFEKIKNFAGDIIITHVYQKSQLYDLRFLDTKWDRQNFLLFRTISCSFTNILIYQIISKIKIVKKWEKKSWRYYHFIHVYLI